MPIPDPNVGKRVRFARCGSRGQYELREPATGTVERVLTRFRDGEAGYRVKLDAPLPFERPGEDADRVTVWTVDWTVLDP